MTDEFGRIILKENDCVDLLYQNPLFDFSSIELVDPDKHNASIAVNFSELSKIKKLEDIGVTVEEWHKSNQSKWKMPKEYYEFDVVSWVLSKCSTQEELQRCGSELLEFAKRDLLLLLSYVKYLVDTMQEHNIVWGVGRGSSVASYVLYKIGIHRVDSLKYQLPINEFFKE